MSRMARRSALALLGAKTAEAGAALVGFLPDGNGAGERTAKKIFAIVSTMDFNGIDPTGKTDCVTALQAAMSYAASIGAKLESPKKATYLISSGLSIPSGLIADFQFSSIKREPDSVFNMLENNGGTKIIIKNLTVDGNRQADGRVASKKGDRFGGIVLNNVTSSELSNVRVNNTVNAEDGKAGVYLGNCTNVYLYNVGGSGNDRSCLFINGGSFNIIFGSETRDNLGSGITSYNASDCEYYDCLTINSGYSGISINGKRCKGRNLRASGTASGYAGVNIGHDDTKNRADDSIIDNIYSFDNLGWGLTIIGSSRVQIRGVHLKGNNNSNLLIKNNSTACKISQITSTASAASGILIQSGAGHEIMSGEIFCNASRGIDVAAGCSASIAADVQIYNNGNTDNTCAGVLLNNSVPQSQQ